MRMQSEFPDGQIDLKRKKILFVMQCLQSNGASRSLLSLLAALQDEYEVEVFLFTHGGALTKLLPEGVRLLPEIPIYKTFATQMAPAVRECLKKGRFFSALFRLYVSAIRALKAPFRLWFALPTLKGDWDVVCSYADDFEMAMVTRKVSSGRTVLWVHEDYERTPKSREILKALLRADGIVGVSVDALGHLVRVLGHEIQNGFVVHNVVDAERIVRLSRMGVERLPEGRFNLVTLGRLSVEKGLDLIPGILAELKHRGVSVMWTLIGDGVTSYADDIRSCAEESGVAGQLNFVGSRDNPYPLLAQADCVVQLSRSEGWCLAISEALVLHKPVIASGLPVFREQIIDGENGLLVDSDVKQFATAIERLVVDPVLRHRLAGRGPVLPLSREDVRREFEGMLMNVL